jgi:hypothetical protein
MFQETKERMRRDVTLMRSMSIKREKCERVADKTVQREMYGTPVRIGFEE